MASPAAAWEAALAREAAASSSSSSSYTTAAAATRAWTDRVLLALASSSASSSSASSSSSLPNAALPNAALPNAALPNAALPDAALPNAALPSHATPAMLVRAVHTHLLWRSEACYSAICPTVAAAVASLPGVDADVVGALAALTDAWLERWREASRKVAQARADAWEARARVGARAHNHDAWWQHRAYFKLIAGEVDDAMRFARYNALEWPHGLSVPNRDSRHDTGDDDDDDGDETDIEYDVNDSDEYNSDGELDDEGGDDDDEDDDDEDEDEDDADAEPVSRTERAARRTARREQKFHEAAHASNLARRRFRMVAIDVVITRRLLLRLWRDIAEATLATGTDRVWLPALAASCRAFDAMPAEHRATHAVQLGNIDALVGALADITAMWSQPDDDDDDAAAATTTTERLARLRSRLMETAIQFGYTDTFRDVLIADEASRAEACHTLLHTAFQRRSVALLHKAVAFGATLTAAHLLGGRRRRRWDRDEDPAGTVHGDGEAFDAAVQAAIFASMRATTDPQSTPSDDALMDVLVRDVSAKVCSHWQGLSAITVPSLLERVVRDWRADWPLPSEALDSLLACGRLDLLRSVLHRGLGEAVSSYDPAALTTADGAAGSVRVRTGPELLDAVAKAAAELVREPGAMPAILEASAAGSAAGSGPTSWTPGLPILTEAAICGNAAAVRAILGVPDFDVNEPTSDRLIMYACGNRDRYGDLYNDHRVADPTEPAVAPAVDEAGRTAVVTMLVNAGVRLQPDDVLRVLRVGTIAPSAVAHMLQAFHPPLSPLVLDALLALAYPRRLSVAVAQVLWDAGADPLGPDGLFLQNAVAANHPTLVAAMLERRAASRAVQPAERLQGVLDHAYDLAILNANPQLADMLAAAGASPLGWTDPSRRYGAISEKRRPGIGNVGTYAHPYVEFYRQLVGTPWPAHGVRTPIAAASLIAPHPSGALDGAADLVAILRYNDPHVRGSRPTVILANVVCKEPAYYKDNDAMLPVVLRHLAPVPAFSAAIGVALCRLLRRENDKENAEEEGDEDDGEEEEAGDEEDGEEEEEGDEGDEEEGDGEDEWEDEDEDEGDEDGEDEDGEDEDEETEEDNEDEELMEGGHGKPSGKAGSVRDGKARTEPGEGQGEAKPAQIVQRLTELVPEGDRYKMYLLRDIFGVSPPAPGSEPGSVPDYVRGHEAEIARLREAVSRRPHLVGGRATTTQANPTERLWAVCNAGSHLWPEEHEIARHANLETHVRDLIAQGADAASVLRRLGPRRSHIRPLLTDAIYDLLRRG